MHFSCTRMATVGFKVLQKHINQANDAHYIRVFAVSVQQYNGHWTDSAHPTSTYNSTAVSTYTILLVYAVSTSPAQLSGTAFLIGQMRHH